MGEENSRGIHQRFQINAFIPIIRY